MEIECICDCNLLFPTGRSRDRDEFDNISELIYYKPCTLSTK
jgi:hypothetical protein